MDEHTLRDRATTWNEHHMLIPSIMPEAGVPTVGMFGFKSISEKKPPSSRSKEKEKLQKSNP